MHLFQFLLHHAQVTLRCGEVFVTEHFLDVSKVGTAAQHLRRQGVAEDVGGDPFPDPGLALVCA